MYSSFENIVWHKLLIIAWQISPMHHVLGYHLATVCMMTNRTGAVPLNKALTVITHHSDTYLPLPNLHLE